MLQLVDAPGASSHHLDGGVLVGQVVGALHRVERVSFGRVGHALGVIAERGVDAPLGGDGVAARGVHLAEDGDVHAGRPRLDGGAQAGQAGADHDELVMDHVAPALQLTHAQRAQIP